MDKQQFDHIENRILQAADEITVPYNDAAWDKMAVLLDEAFKRDRRRGGIWWWFSLLLIVISASGIYFYYSHPSIPSNKLSGNLKEFKLLHETKEKKIEPVIEKLNEKGASRNNQGRLEMPTPGSQPDINDEKNKVLLKKQSGNLDLPQQKKRTPFTSSNLNKGESPGAPGSNRKLNKENIQSNEATPFDVSNSDAHLRFKTRNNRKNETHTNPSANIPRKELVLEKSVDVDKNETNEVSANIKTDKTGDKTPGIKKPVEKPDDAASVITPAIDSSQKTFSAITKVPDTVIQQDSLGSKESVKTKYSQIKLDNNIPPRGFYFLASTAADATGVKKISTSDIKPVTGLGVGYRFNKRISVQTGFYAGKRIYTAGPDDYKIKPGSYVAKIISANAECYIYDIPLTLRYDAFRRKSSSIYFVTGLSSYILKRETYDMHFFNPSGTYKHMSYTYKNNANYLSIADFSLGFEHKLTSAFYIQAEPYLKLPLSGLGEGDVKLLSGGIQVGIKYQPVKRKK